MATEIRVPTLGESVTEATIGTWLKKVGDAVAVDEPIVELETDKVSIEVPSPVAGKLSEIAAQEGETVELNALLATVAEGEAGAAASDDKKAPAGEDEKPAAAEGGKDNNEKSGASGTDMPAAPSAQKMMAENDISADKVEGSGKRGQVLKGDVMSAINKAESTSQSAPTAAKAPRATPPAADADREERVRMSRLRQTIARRLKDAQNTAAMLTTYNEVDMSAVMDLRNKYKELFLKKHDVKLGFMGFFTKAVTHALKELPAINAEIDGTDFVYKNFCHIGVAVGTDKGLVVPVVRDADQMSIAEIEKEIGRLGRAARDGELSMADMQGGTFTISNGGVYGSLMSSPILNAPQSGILGMHKIQERPVALNGQVVIRPMMYLALSYDHRIVDGKEAVTFLVRVKESLEDPERLVLDL
ncbi:2-oxoglutarate dehydrogenase complex dihydrolipoyllysine-residue succinyltransferase [Pseudohoeflea coraliihabitans]|uniref:Dihydrolipoyllysine-residue succinyltransferase component of 2-oxoglutarate dehydrogenase complex n=1 Tax=Pseudohoeflea coraliihabitans TaxID=2860393 RepID=A0ABS6WLC0_9HYPH|nr:2-oxoglutarate dehydrogenase complex dihydrolipoyllysine-residue succinyltransferase [Pseudohoeflea sp. DP4N28-3]MBW3096759.1 2-oxoglutarate dehydrogenase complex dihydrolipoyllysine-residue succinyltransferase [Pseudohoeflea sp. DP4N28-3]